MANNAYFYDDSMDWLFTTWETFWARDLLIFLVSLILELLILDLHFTPMQPKKVCTFVKLSILIANNNTKMFKVHLKRQSWKIGVKGKSKGLLFEDVSIRIVVNENETHKILCGCISGFHIFSGGCVCRGNCLDHIVTVWDESASCWTC